MTTLDPLHEVLFQSWAKANGIENHDDSDNMFDHRGHYKLTNGLVHQPGEVNQMADQHNAAVGAPAAAQQAQMKMHEAKMKMVGDQLKEHFATKDKDAEISKAKNNLHHLMLKRHLGI